MRPARARGKCVEFFQKLVHVGERRHQTHQTEVSRFCSTKRWRILSWEKTLTVCSTLPLSWEKTCTTQAAMNCSTRRCRTLSRKKTPTATAPKPSNFRPPCVCNKNLAVSHCTGWGLRGRGSAQPVGRPTRDGQVLQSARRPTIIWTWHAAPAVYWLTPCFTKTA